VTAYLQRRNEAMPRAFNIGRTGSVATIGAALLAGMGWFASALAAPCIDTTLPIAIEEQRLPNKLTATNANPFAVDLLYGAGFTHFESDFITALGGTSSVDTTVTPNVVVTDTTSPCGAGAPADYNAAFALITAQGTNLWKTAVKRAQGRLISGDLTQVPRSDDRPLYWARETMTRALNRWSPPWGLASDQRSALELQLERTSRGQLDINFPAGPGYKRLLMSSFDVFTLPAPGTNGTGMRNGNPSAATALSLDGTRLTLPDGTIGVIEVFTLPVNYPPFGLASASATNPTNFPMQEETIGPYFMPGPQRVDASISMSQGSGDQFNLEMWNGRFHGPSAGNDTITECPTANNQRVPQADDCDVYPPAKWLGYSPTPWTRDFPPQFTTTSLPIAAMIAAATGAGVPHPPGDSFPPANLDPNYPDPTGAFGVQWHVNYTVFRNCDALTGTTNTATVNVNVNTFTFPPPTPPTAPLATDCARQGGGGDYLSNESAYRNTLMRDVFGLSIPAGHIHTPVMTRFSTGDNALITDAMFEQYRASIVQQARNLVFTVLRNLGPQPPLVTQ
jgi:hypothetical protein